MENFNEDHLCYFLIGLKIDELGNRHLDFVFPYTTAELNKALLEEGAFAEATFDEKRKMVLKHKQKFSEGCLLASYRIRTNGIRVILIKTDGETGVGHIENIVQHNISDFELADCDITDEFGLHKGVK